MKHLTVEKAISIIEARNCQCPDCEGKLRYLNNIKHLNETERAWMVKLLNNLSDAIKDNRNNNCGNN